MIQSKSKLNFNKLFVIIFVILYFSSICFWYDDTNSNITHSINIWKALFSGDFFHYYSYNIESFTHGFTNHKGGYEVFLYLIVSIWQLPLYILQLLIGNNIVFYFFARCYAKGFFVFMIFLCFKELKKICKKYNFAELLTNYILIIFSTSCFIVSSACIVSQIDIVGLYFILLTYNHFIKGNTKLFLLFFTLATLCKSFALFIFIPLILLKEKNIFKIAVLSITPVIVMIVLNLPFKLIDPEGCMCKEEPTATLIHGLLSARFPVFGRGVPIIFLAYAALGIFCYLKGIEAENQDKKNYWYIYISFISSLIFTLMVESPYRNLYIVPFFSIMFFYNTTNQKRRFLVLTLANISMMIALLIRFPYCFDYQFMKNMLIDKILPLRKFELQGLMQISDTLLAPSAYDLWLFLYAIFTMWAIGFCVVNRPSKITTNNLNNIDTSLNDRDIIFYSISNIIICNITLIFFCIMVIRNIIMKFL